MARQPLIRPLLVAVLALAGCPDEEPFEGAFLTPVAATVVQPQHGGPFQEPVGYVASAKGGQVGLLALKEGIFLADHGHASFLRGPHLATGHLRQLTDLAAWTPAPDRIDLFVGDRAFEHLLQVPHVEGLDASGFPIRRAAEVVEVERVGEGAAQLEELRASTGFTTSEDWVIEFDGRAWQVTGSRSGLQHDRAEPGEPYEAWRHALAFTVVGEAPPGTRFEVRTEAGLTEHDVGGAPAALAMAPDQGRLALVIEDRQLQRPVLRWFDPEAGALDGEVELPEDAAPHRLAFSEDGQSLFVADQGRAAAWEVRGDEVIEHVLPWPVSDVAPLDTDDGRLLYVAPVGGRSVWILDLESGDFLDVNPWVPGVHGIDLRSPVTGIAAIPLRFEYPEQDGDDVHRWGRGVAVSLASGRVVFMEERTGCLVRDPLGPRTEEVPGFIQGDYDVSWRELATGPFLERNALTRRHVQVNPCGGVAVAETWTLRFDRRVQAWRVRGSISGEQERLAYEDERYLSDDGAVSFVVRSGSAPTQDGWRIEFRTRAGVNAADGRNVGMREREIPFDLPGRPVFFHFRPDAPEGAGWQAEIERPYLLVPAAAPDLVGRVDPHTGDIDAIWR